MGKGIKQLQVLCRSQNPEGVAQLPEPSRALSEPKPESRPPWLPNTSLSMLPELENVMIPNLARQSISLVAFLRLEHKLVFGFGRCRHVGFSRVGSVWISSLQWLAEALSLLYTVLGPGALAQARPMASAFRFPWFQQKVTLLCTSDSLASREVFPSQIEMILEPQNVQ